MIELTKVLDPIGLMQESLLFRGLKKSDLAAIAAMARKTTVKKKDFFFQQGERTSSIYFLCSGQVNLTRVTSEGHQFMVRVINAGGILGHISCLGGLSGHPGTALAAAPCEALVWDARTFSRVMDRYPQITANAFRVMAFHVEDLMDRMGEALAGSVESRIAVTLLRLMVQAGKPQEHGYLIDLTLSRQSLGEMAGTTLFSTSRILSRWQRQGLIRTAKKRLLIRYPDKLTEKCIGLAAD